MKQDDIARVLNVSSGHFLFSYSDHIQVSPTHLSVIAPTSN